jgi:hypothetical protein
MTLTDGLVGVVLAFRHVSSLSRKLYVALSCLALNAVEVLGTQRAALEMLDALHQVPQTRGLTPRSSQMPPRFLAHDLAQCWPRDLKVPLARPPFHFDTSQQDCSAGNARQHNLMDCQAAF